MSASYYGGPDTAWPCRCEGCAPPLDSCDACGAAPGQVCSVRCPEHQSNKVKCPTMAQRLAPEPQPEEHW
jgi:hypothetical protein